MTAQRGRGVRGLHGKPVRHGGVAPGVPSRAVMTVHDEHPSAAEAVRGARARGLWEVACQALVVVVDPTPSVNLPQVAAFRQPLGLLLHELVGPAAAAEVQHVLDQELRPGGGQGAGQLHDPPHHRNGEPGGGLLPVLTRRLDHLQRHLQLQGGGSLALGEGRIAWKGDVQQPADHLVQELLLQQLPKVELPNELANPHAALQLLFTRGVTLGLGLVVGQGLLELQVTAQHKRHQEGGVALLTGRDLGVEVVEEVGVHLTERQLRQGLLEDQWDDRVRGLRLEVRHNLRGKTLVLLRGDLVQASLDLLDHLLPGV
eukprot:RCo055257